MEEKSKDTEQSKESGLQGSQQDEPGSMPAIVFVLLGGLVLIIVLAAVLN